MSSRAQLLSGLFPLVLVASAAAQRHPPRPMPPRPAPPLVRTESTAVQARITDGVADIEVKVRFRNDGGRDAEKVLMLPIPKGAVADRIAMKIGDKLVEGEVLTADKARGVYEGIVRRRLDPALLEYVERDLLRLRVFPIPPKGTQEVELRFRMLLPESGGLYKLEYPTRAIDEGRFSLGVEIRSRKSLKNAWSPLQGFELVQKDDHLVRGSFESEQRPARDPVLFYSLDERDFGLDLLCWRREGASEGTFLLMLAPKREWKEEKELCKSITFVIDTSGSMEGEKIEQARKALRMFVGSLKPGDRFNIVAFSTEARPFKQELVAADEANLGAARGWIDGLKAMGGTNLHEAVTMALAQKPAEGSVPLCVVLTDGLPTVGVADVDKILVDSTKANTGGTRVFCFGVGNDVNTRLLDSLAADHGGERDYVAPGENLEVKTGALFEKLAHPVMTDVTLAADGVEWTRMVPGKLPPLFRGSRIVLAGRYTGDGNKAIRLRGKVGGEPQEYVYEGSFPAVATDDDFVGTIWAQRRVAQLLDNIRLNGRNPELVEEVRRLGKEFGLVTPFTSGLVVEEGERIAFGRGGRFGWQDDGPPRPQAPGRAFDERLRRELDRAGAADAEPSSGGNVPVSDSGDDFGITHGGAGGKAGGAPTGQAGGPSTPAPSESGAGAVTRSKKVARLLYLDSVEQEGKRLWAAQRIKDRTFYLVSGTWIDGRFKKEMEQKLVKVEAFSADYFALLKQHPALAPYLAFSTSILVVVDADTVVEVVPAKQPAEGAKDGEAGDTGVDQGKDGAKDGGEDAKGHGGSN
ncbi:MAG: VIT domain-containing protein [Planctomycetota bacterium]